MISGSFEQILVLNGTFQDHMNKAIIESHDPNSPGSFENSLNRIEAVATVVATCNRLGVVASQVMGGDWLEAGKP